MLGQLVSTADSEDEAGRNVAYQVALRIGHATNSFPRWACWTDADAWMAYDDAAQLPPGRKQVEAYESVVTRSPGSGLARPRWPTRSSPASRRPAWPTRTR